MARRTSSPSTSPVRRISIRAAAAAAAAASGSETPASTSSSRLTKSQQHSQQRQQQQQSGIISKLGDKLSEMRNNILALFQSDQARPTARGISARRSGSRSPQPLYARYLIIVATMLIAYGAILFALHSYFDNLLQRTYRTYAAAYVTLVYTSVYATLQRYSRSLVSLAIVGVIGVASAHVCNTRVLQSPSRGHLRSGASFTRAEMIAIVVYFTAIAAYVTLKYVPETFR